MGCQTNFYIPTGWTHEQIQSRAIAKLEKRLRSLLSPDDIVRDIYDYYIDPGQKLKEDIALTKKFIQLGRQEFNPAIADWAFLTDSQRWSLFSNDDQSSRYLASKDTYYTFITCLSYRVKNYPEGRVWSLAQLKEWVASSKSDEYVFRPIKRHEELHIGGLFARYPGAYIEFG